MATQRMHDYNGERFEAPEYVLGISTKEARKIECVPPVSICGPLCTSQVLIVAGTPGVGKSFWMMDMMHHLSSGQDFESWRVPESKMVLWIDGEMPLNQLQGRWQHMPASDRFDIIYEELMLEQGIPMPRLNQPLWQQHFLEPWYQDMYDVFVIDTVTAMIDCPPSMSRYAPEYWLQMSHFNQQMRANGKTLIYIDHIAGYTMKKGCTPKISGSEQKLQNVDNTWMLVDSREDKESTPEFDIHVGKNRVAPVGYKAKSSWEWKGDWRQVGRV